jgi:two-component system, OmpR family, copper resistance phosphate regulon response regulator CusR
MHILIVEDEEKIAKAVAEGLKKEHFKVTIVSTGEDAFFLLNTQKFDMVLLDLMLPGRDGLEILKALRKQNCNTPVLVITACDSIEDRVKGLDSGADDYLTKPFAFPELLARIKALSRRGMSDRPVNLKVSDLELDCISRKVTRGGIDILLTTREFELLEYLMRNQGNIVSREMLANEVWQVIARVTALDNVIDVHIARLRKKIDEEFEPKILKTVRGLGFIIKEEKQ